MNPNDPEVEVVVGREDWDQFLSDIERLMSLHEHIIKVLKELRRQNQALKLELSDATQSHPVSVDSSASAVGTVSERRGLMTRLLGFRQRRDSSRGSVEQAAEVSAAKGVATCGKCGFQVTKPSRFCEGCGASFGVLICGCGRELGPDDRFCDGCGEKVIG
jgi:hypothetical protein